MKKIYIIISLIWLSFNLQLSANDKAVSIASPPPNCNAQFNYSVDTSNALLIHFTDASIGLISNWTWDFGDGSNSFIQNPSHSYSQAGNYSVTLIVNDSSFSCIDTLVVLITVSNNPPCQANFSQLADLTNPLLIHFTDLSTGILSFWNWDFGDGTYSTLMNPDHLYTNAGTYQVSLFISDSLGSCSDSIMHTIVVTVGTPNCQSAFSYSVDSSNNLKINFTDLSTGFPYQWHWDFGDGSSSNSQHPTHTYSTAGNYNVQLSIITQSCNDSSSQNINILPNSNLGSLLVYVFADSNYMDSGMVFLYQTDSLNSTVQVYDSAFPTNSQGLIYYNFPNITKGNYFVYAKLNTNSTLSNQFYNSWAPNEFNWQNAATITVNSNNNWTSIILQKSNVSYPQGTASISGSILLKNTGGNTAAAGVDIFLLLNDSSIISKSVSNQQGEYKFSGLAFGEYIIHPEIVGKYSHDKIVSLNFDQPKVDTIVFVIDGNKIITGFEKPKNELSSIRVYPNPFSNNISISGNILYETKIEIHITDISGRNLFVEQLNTSSNFKRNIDLQNLPKGLYFITIRSNNSSITKKIIKL